MTQLIVLVLCIVMVIVIDVLAISGSDKSERLRIFLAIFVTAVVALDVGHTLM